MILSLHWRSLMKKIVSLLFLCFIAFYTMYSKADLKETTLSYEIHFDKSDMALNIFALMNKTMTVNYRSENICNDKTTSTESNEISMAVNNQIQLTVRPLRNKDGMVETLFIVMIPEQSNNVIYKIDEQCSLELGEKTFHKYTIIENFKPNEAKSIKVGDNDLLIKLTEIKI
jgi:hypothetical protein